MKLVITGANGMLAQAVQNYCRSAGDLVVALSHAEMDISDEKAVSAKISEEMPNAVINCAAFTDVDRAESNIKACYAANVDGVANLARACRSVNAAFVTVSTDYVFDGTKLDFYTQRDTPNPLGVYARTKREGEILAFAVNPRSIIVRSGWIYGLGGTNFLSAVPQMLADGRSVKAIGDSFGTPTFALDLAARLRELAEADLPGVYHATNAGPGCSYLDFANAVCDQGRFDHQRIEPASYKELQRPAPRPVSSKLTCLVSEKLGFSQMRHWEAALADYLEQR
ncbi:MAG: dTDP-4-dehydrorhamnose reductase [Acidobacteria bacterium]|nr:dTDP-4-dehydrorhamnose reductase [Acidobacteriota bacterium]